MKINVNGVEYEHEGDTISYDDIATIVAFEERWQPPLPVLSVWYQWQGDGDLTRQGILVQDKPIKLAAGTAFRAERTGNA